jgi:hypothetical protein
MQPLGCAGFAKVFESFSRLDRIDSFSRKRIIKLIKT